MYARKNGRQPAQAYTSRPPVRDLSSTMKEPAPNKVWIRVQVVILRFLMRIGMVLHRYPPPIPPSPSFVRTLPRLEPESKRVKLYFYTPKTYVKDKLAGNRYPVVVNFHGGGFCIGKATDDARWARAVVEGADTVVVSVGYRLAPEDPFPAAVDDGVRALQYLEDNAEELGLDVSRVSISGFSSGGNLAFTVPLRRHLLLQDTPQISPTPSVLTPYETRDESSINLHLSTLSQHPQGNTSRPAASRSQSAQHLLRQTTTTMSTNGNNDSNNNSQPSTPTSSLKIVSIISWYPIVDYVLPRHVRRDRSIFPSKTLPKFMTTMFDHSYMPLEANRHLPFASPLLAPPSLLADALPRDIFLYVCEWDMLLHEGHEPWITILSLYILILAAEDEYYLSLLDLETATDRAMMEEFARLHNSILQKGIEKIPNASDHIQRNLGQQVLENKYWDWFDVTELPTYYFLTLLDYYEDRNISWQPYPLTPYVLQPSPRNFFKFADWIEDDEDDYDFIILLYERHYLSEFIEDGGLFFNMLNGTAYYFEFPGRFPPLDEWLPLSDVLDEWLAMWDIGKYYWDAEKKTCLIRDFVEEDVLNTVEAWDTLIYEIESRRPASHVDMSQDMELALLPPLDISLLDRYMISDFAKQLLSTIRLPKNFTFIAPGTTFLTPDLLEKTYGSEPVDSFRIQWTKKEKADWLPHPFTTFPTLLFPTQPVTSVGPESYFDSSFGFGKFTIQRFGGLYVSYEAEGVEFISDSGDNSAFWYNSACPWEPYAYTKVFEVLDKWTELVRDGTWTIDDNGVKEDIVWFDRNMPLTKLDWMEQDI
ncbi:lipase [Arthroderma uncinatum]|uniref:lipase n=1 Tax=Arthroderma uncinatum TaxID=74035 RepID=UPI00144A52D5|nr:lipase [Arthroderma uncinatum]KAF3483993.1 lipase [Arthroderma uncinatum]